MGELDYSHLGQPITADEIRAVGDVKAESHEHNLALLATIKEDEFAEELLQKTIKDARASRMTMPTLGESSM